MQFESLLEFVQMGGHGVYVWLSYGITLMVITLNFILPKLEQKQLLKSLQKRIQRESLSK